MIKFADALKVFIMKLENWKERIWKMLQNLKRFSPVPCWWWWKTGASRVCKKWNFAAFDITGKWFQPNIFLKPVMMRWIYCESHSNCQLNKLLMIVQINFWSWRLFQEQEICLMRNQSQNFGTWCAIPIEKMVERAIHVLLQLCCWLITKQRNRLEVDLRCTLSSTSPNIPKLAKKKSITGFSWTTLFTWIKEITILQYPSIIS